MKRLLIGVLLLGAAFLSFVYYDHISPSELAAETTVIVPRGKGFSASIDALAEAGVVSNPLFLKAVAYASGDARKIKAGEYLFVAGISAQDVLKQMVAGDVVRHKITIAEGLNVREVVALLRAETILEGEVPTNIVEGSLLPETYYFTYGDTRASVIARMQASMQKTLAEAWEKREGGLPLANAQEALILASIVEKETGVADERPRVAAVFINRLRRGMRLQSDPTTIYGIEKMAGKELGRNLTRADLESQTAYNTYVIDGLPPTPIANPGKASIEAVLHPLDTDELYFVATGNGGHNFASTLGEHNKNVAKYRATLAR